MTAEVNKHYHVEYHELNGCHFNPIAEEFQEDDVHSIIRLKTRIHFFLMSLTDAINFFSFPFFISQNANLSKTQLIIRSGGCFVSICRGISIFMGLLVFLFFLSFAIFFSTKYAYEVRLVSFIAQLPLIKIILLLTDEAKSHAR